MRGWNGRLLVVAEEPSVAGRKETLLFITWVDGGRAVDTLDEREQTKGPCNEARLGSRQEARAKK